MTKEQLIEMGLTEEQADKVMSSLNDNFVTKKRFDEVNTTKKKLEEDLTDRDKQLEDLKKVDAESLQAEITRLQDENKTAKENYEAELKQLQIDNAVEKALIGAKAKNIKAVKALLDLENVDLDGETVKGLDDQLKKLQESEESNFLFNVESEPKNPQFKGIKPGEGKDNPPGKGTQPASLSAAVKSALEKTN